jgi:hypothetical protein
MKETEYMSNFLYYYADMGRISVKAQVLFELEKVNPPTANEDQLIETWNTEGLTEDEKLRRQEERDYVFVFSNVLFLFLFFFVLWLNLACYMLSLYD